MLLKALPFALTFVQAPLILTAALQGGWWIAGPFIWGWVIVSLLDKIMGLDTENIDPATADEVLFWHKMVTWAWVPVQMALIVVCLWCQPGGISIPARRWACSRRWGSAPAASASPSRTR